MVPRCRLMGDDEPPERVLDSLGNRGIYFYCLDTAHGPSAVQLVLQPLSRFSVAANACIASNSRSKLQFEFNRCSLALLSKCNTRIYERQALWLDCVVAVTRSFLNSALHGGGEDQFHAPAALLLCSCPRYLLSTRLDRSQSLCGRLVKKKGLSCVGAGNWTKIPRFLARSLVRIPAWMSRACSPPSRPAISYSLPYFQCIH